MSMKNTGRQIVIKHTSPSVAQMAIAIFIGLLAADLVRAIVTVAIASLLSSGSYRVG